MCVVFQTTLLYFVLLLLSFCWKTVAGNVIHLFHVYQFVYYEKCCKVVTRLDELDAGDRRCGATITNKG